MSEGYWQEWRRQSPGAGSNIDNVAMEGDGAYTTMSFMLQVRNRYHLAQVMRGLRRIPEVAKISRMKG